MVTYCENITIEGHMFKDHLLKDHLSKQSQKCKVRIFNTDYEISSLRSLKLKVIFAHCVLYSYRQRAQQHCTTATQTIKASKQISPNFSSRSSKDILSSCYCSPPLLLQQRKSILLKSSSLKKMKSKLAYKIFMIHSSLFIQK